jgi:hypothetical protein
LFKRNYLQRKQSNCVLPGVKNLKDEEKKNRKKYATEVSLSWIKKSLTTKLG